MVRKSVPNACCVWDVTVHDKISHEELIAIFAKHCKAWCFQKEKGKKKGKEHYQCRISLKTKVRLGGVRKINAHWHWSITSVENRDNNFYVTKEDTRIAGPWCETDEYVDERFTKGVPNRWQKKVLKHIDEDEREGIVNVIYDPDGRKGKTWLMKYCHYNKKASFIPPMDTHKDMMRFVYSQPEEEAYIIDIPRSYNKRGLIDTFSALENLSDGICYDDRYRGVKRVMKTEPHVWVFCNVLPEDRWLSPGRLKVWTIADGKLRIFEADDEVIL